MEAESARERKPSRKTALREACSSGQQPPDFGRSLCSSPSKIVEQARLHSHITPLQAQQSYDQPTQRAWRVLQRIQRLGCEGCKTLVQVEGTRGRGEDGSDGDDADECREMKEARSVTVRERKRKPKPTRLDFAETLIQHSHLLAQPATVRRQRVHLCDGQKVSASTSTADRQTHHP